MDLVLGALVGRATIEHVAEEYGLTRENILAALAYAILLTTIIVLTISVR